VKPPEIRRYRRSVSEWRDQLEVPPASGMRCFRTSTTTIHGAKALEQGDALEQRGRIRFRRGIARSVIAATWAFNPHNRRVRRCIPGRSWWNPCRRAEAFLRLKVEAAPQCRSAESPRASRRRTAMRGYPDSPRRDVDRDFVEQPLAGPAGWVRKGARAVHHLAIDAGLAGLQMSVATSDMQEFAKARVQAKQQGRVIPGPTPAASRAGVGDCAKQDRRRHPQTPIP